MTDMFITKDDIEKRKVILKTDLKTVKDRMAELDRRDQKMLRCVMQLMVQYNSVIFF